MVDESNVLSTNIIYALLDIIHETHAGLPRDDKSRLELVEIRPRSGTFSKVKLSCSIAPNDPADPSYWLDEEASWPGDAYNAYPTRDFIEMGLNQRFNMRFSIDFTMFFMNARVGRDEALRTAQLIFARLHQAILAAGERRGGKFGPLYRADDYGFSLVRGNNAVKKRQLRPGGSDKKPLYKGRMWLQFECLIETNQGA